MESKFTGRLWGLIGVNLAQFFIILLTLGIGTAWAICLKERWCVEHSVLNGCHLKFDGKGIQLLGNFLKWTLLVLITFGIYSLWLGIKMEQWRVKHTHLCVSNAERAPATVPTTVYQIRVEY